MSSVTNLLGGLALAAMAMFAVTTQPLAAHSQKAPGLAGLFAGKTVYTSDFPTYGQRNDVMRFATDGRVETVYRIEDTRRGLRPFYDEGTDRGQWRIQGDSLCIEWYGNATSPSGCFRIEELSRNEFSADQYQAVDVSGARHWRFTVAQ